MYHILSPLKCNKGRLFDFPKAAVESSFAIFSYSDNDFETERVCKVNILPTPPPLPHTQKKKTPQYNDNVTWKVFKKLI